MLPDDHGDPQTYAIIGAAMEVHKHLGRGFLEAVYQEACGIEFGLKNIPCAREVMLVVKYKSVPSACRYKADFICYGEILVELKALTRLTDVEVSQVLNYVKTTGLKRALLLNFGSESLEVRRFVNNYPG